MAQNQPRWPSLEEQLAAAKALPGSVLEKLQLLAPEQAAEDAGFPPWVRAHWRKAHPEVPHSNINPAAGYSDILHRPTRRCWLTLSCCGAPQ